jgi:hypothetical protein
MISSNHTKRSPEFRFRLSLLIDKLRRGLELSAEDREKIAELLEKNTTNLHSIVNAGDAEPLFPLRGQDRIAAMLVETWAAKLESLPNLTAQQKMKAESAKQCVSEMLEFKPRKFPD